MKRLLGFSPIIACVLLMLGACAGTQSAYKAAQTRPDTALADTAYVVAEHYAAVIKEAADLKQSGIVPPDAVRWMQTADDRAKPLIIGNPPSTPGLRQLADSYRKVKDAKTQEELQRAVDDAVLALSDLMKAVNAARRPS